MKTGCLCTVLLLLLAAPAAAEVQLHGLLSTGDRIVRIDSVQFQVGMIETYPTPGWGGGQNELDTFDFPPVPVWPTFGVVFGEVDGNPVQVTYAPFLPDTWYVFGPTIPEEARLMFWQTAGVEEPGSPPAGRLSATASPSVASGRVMLSCAAAEPVRLTIADAAGRKVLTRPLRPDPAGIVLLCWDGRDDHGRALPGGTYICRFESARGAAATRVLLVR